MKQFISSYQGSAEYRINGKRYEVRTLAFHQNPFRPEIFTSEILPMVGCFWCRDDHARFPPAEIAAEFPGYVAARYVTDLSAPYAYASRVEYLDTPHVRYNVGLDATEVDL